MSVSREDVASALDKATQPIEGLLSSIPGAGSVLGPIVGQALGLAADLVRAGDDAAIVIERIRRSPELLEKARAEARWDAKLDDRFPRESP